MTRISQETHNLFNISDTKSRGLDATRSGPAEEESFNPALDDAKGREVLWRMSLELPSSLLKGLRTNSRLNSPQPRLGLMRKKRPRRASLGLGERLHGERGRRIADARFLRASSRA
jgi:hypothetical protein